MGRQLENLQRMEVEALLAVSGPEDLNDAAKKATEECIATTAAAAIGAGFASGGAAAVAAAKVAFPACMATKGQQIADLYSINVETNAHWTDWG